MSKRRIEITVLGKKHNEIVRRVLDDVQYTVRRTI